MEIASRLTKMDYAVTVCSIVPFALRETKPGLYPGEFIIPACKDMNKDVETLVIDESRFYVYLDLERGSFPVRASAEQIGISIIDDYINAEMGIDEGCHPGLFLIQGKPTKKEVLDGDLIGLAREFQLRWYRRLVEIADDDWSKYHQHRAISDKQRHAAKALELDREWIINIPDQLNVNQAICLVCRSPLAPETIMCPQCNFIVNPEAYEKIKDRFVGVGVQQMNTNPSPQEILKASIRK